MRPLLDHTRAEVVAYASGNSVSFVADPSNASLRFLRNRVRLQILPALRALNPAFDEEMLRLSKRAAAWRAEIDALVRPLESGRASGRTSFRVDRLDGLSDDEAAVVAQAIAARAGVRLDRRGTLRLASFLVQKRLRGRVQLSGAYELERIGDVVRFFAAPQQPAGEPVVLADNTTWGAFRFIRAKVGTLERGAWGATLPAGEGLTVRAWQPGDRMVAAGSSRPRRVKRFLSDAGISGSDRTGWPVVLSGETIVWIPGVVRSSLAHAIHAAPSTGGGARAVNNGNAYICDRLEQHAAPAFGRF
jgi:tRNA(Ile)-lysidine synthetase-like protein